MRLNNGFDDGQAKPGAFATAMPGSIRAIKALEQVRQVFGRNGGAGVRDADSHRAPVAVHACLYGATFRGVANGI